MQRRLVAAATATCAIAAGVLSVSSRAQQTPTITFGLTPTTSTIAYHAESPQPNPLRPPQETAYSLWSGRAFTVADFNGDGLQDIAIAPTYLRYQPKLTFQFWINQGGGRFADKTSEVMDGPAVPIGGTTTYAADFNRDGRMDVFIGDSGLEDKTPTVGFDGGNNHVLLSQPGGRLKDVSSTSLPGDPAGTNHPSNLADINGDGAMDIVNQRLGGPATGTLGQGTSLIINDGSGRFTQTTRGLPREIAYMVRSEASAVPDRHAAGTVGACDFDRNGRADLVTASYTNVLYPRNVRMFEQNAAGEFTERFRTPLPPQIVELATQRTTNNVGAAGLVCADLDRDGLGDVAIHWETDTGFTYIQFLRNAGGFRFEDVTLNWFGAWETYYSVRGGSRAVGAIEFRDINGDGTLDFTPKNQGNYEPEQLWNGAFAYLNDGTGRFRPLQYRPTNPSATMADLARAIGCVGYCSIRPMLFDATGDGQTDLVLIETGSLRDQGPPQKEGRVLIHVLEGRVSP
jgi:hypothetical protein